MSFKIAIIGDVHSFWTEYDTQYFNDSDYDLLLFTGDLPRIVGGVKDAALLAELTKPGILIPGNHDAATVPQFLAELKNYQWLCRLTATGHSLRVNRIANALGHIEMGGFSLHPIAGLGTDYACILARPHSMGGDRLYFSSYIKKRFGVTSLEDSKNLLCKLIDEAPKNLLFLAHNGPHGLGTEPTDPWGCDFDPKLGDFGDRDLSAAIEYAKEQGKNILAVIAGHMHHHIKGIPHSEQKGRDWCVQKDSVMHINAARVPRIFKQNDETWHHHIELNVGESVVCSEVLTSPSGKINYRQAET